MLWLAWEWHTMPALRAERQSIYVHGSYDANDFLQLLGSGETLALLW
jgi:hypothetical protein